MQLILSLIVVLTLTCHAQAYPAIQAPAAIVMDAQTGEVLMAKNIHEQRSPASLTKMLTTLIALEQASPRDVVTVSNQAARMNGASIGLSPGERVTVESLLISTFFRSGNDGATALAEHLSGSVASFANVMNTRARQLGMNNSNFRNPHGLDEANHYSTAYDLAVLTRRALENPGFASLAETNVERVNWGNSLRTVWNINSFLWRFDGASGVKTGYTSQAGYCLAASATRGNRTLILVLLGAQTSNQRWNEAIKWLNYAFDNYYQLVRGSDRRVYTVQFGDTLWDIAQMFDVTLEELAEYNNLANPNVIRLGQELRIP